MIWLLAAAGCTDDPVYVQGPMPVEVADGGGSASASLLLPIRLETTTEMEARAARMTELGVMIPFVTREDLELSVEWTVKNLSDADGVARVQMNGANEWFAYNPAAFVEDVENQDEPPPLSGDVPIEVAAGSERSGVFREDQLAEASLDLELITRGGFTPFAALLDVHEDMDEMTDTAGMTVPSEVFAGLVRIDMTLVADRHMVLEFSVRARDHRDPPLLHEDLLDALPEELQPLAPTEYVPPAAP
ncbi:MAG TPA: hypothetical protein VFU21_30455 [Kofleriaceae bacterium]|nr:hypothetical protein [Kofleriaceae bacterium]